MKLDGAINKYKLQKTLKINSHAIDVIFLMQLYDILVLVLFRDEPLQVSWGFSLTSNPSRGLIWNDRPWRRWDTCVFEQLRNIAQDIINIWLICSVII